MSSVSAQTLPFAWYADEQLLRRERAEIFARTWQYAGRAAEVTDVRRRVGAAASIEAWGPFLFVNGDPDAAPLAEWLGELPTILARDVDIDALTFHSRVDFGSNANWKIVVENFLECYHCPTAHPGFSEAVDVHPDRYRLEPHPTFSSQFCEARRSGERGQFHLLYPNTGINVFPGPPNLSIGPIVPDGPARTERYLDYFFAPGVDAAWLRDFFALDEQVGAEDRLLVESVHRGTTAGVLDHGRLLLASEPLIAAFQSWLAAQLRDEDC